MSVHDIHYSYFNSNNNLNMVEYMNVFLEEILFYDF